MEPVGWPFFPVFLPVHSCIFYNCLDRPLIHLHGREPCRHLRTDFRNSSHWHTGICGTHCRCQDRAYRNGHDPVQFAHFGLPHVEFLQAPFLATRIETAMSASISPLLSDFHWILGSAALATALGAFFVPSAQRAFARAVGLLHLRRSLPGVVIHGLHPRRLLTAQRFLAVPRLANLNCFGGRGGLTWGFLLLNTIAVALWTVGVFASLYAGALEPDLRVTCSNLSSIINGVATIIMFLLLDPQLSLLTDDVARERIGQATFRSAVTSLIGARFAGALLAQVLLVPAAVITAYVARVI
ncbi:MAG: DUF2837 family protein [Verrucomicrobiales bacterium]